MFRRSIWHLSLMIVLLFPGIGLAMTPEETVMITNAAERGSDSAQLLLALEYLHGDSAIQKDEKRAAYWLEQSATQGNAVAERILGDLYEQGRGVPLNPTLSADWRKKAADRGNTDAQLKLGKMYLAGKGVEKNPEKGEFWLKRAAEEGGNAEAKQLLGQLGHNRSSELRDKELAGNPLADSATHGYESTVEFMTLLEDAKFALAEMFHQHPVNLHKLAEDGDANSQYLLATRYESGHGEKQNYLKALYWFNKAAENGNVMAMKSLAHIYKKGLDGTYANPDASKYWAEKAQAAQK